MKERLKSSSKGNSRKYLRDTTDFG